MLRQCIFAPPNADVAKLVDALDLGSSAVRRGGSIPFIRTNKKARPQGRAFRFKSLLNLLAEHDVHIDPAVLVFNV